LLNENPHGLLLVRDELAGFLAKMESEEYQSERAFYLEAFNGDGKYTYDRIGRGTIPIENCTLSIIGGIQPARIAPLVRGAATGISDDGLIQRLQLTVWPDGRTAILTQPRGRGTRPRFAICMTSPESSKRRQFLAF
jgi:Protein of unknown function (DUF3987)